jgi:uncharacterized membrane protein
MYSVLYAHACTSVLVWAPASCVLLAHTVFLLARYFFGVLYSIKKNTLFWYCACHLSMTWFQ